MRIFLLALIAAFGMVACVSKGEYEALELAKKRAEDSLGNIIEGLQAKVDRLRADTTSQGRNLREARRKIATLEKELSELQVNYRNLKSSSTDEIQKLLADLEQTQSDLRKREARIQEIEEKLAQRDSKLKALFDRLQNALLGFKESGLTVSIQNGKVYVSLSNQLLFGSGSTRIDKKGKEALAELATVLNANTDINVLVEGHTDNQAVRSGSRFTDNWDLSVLRSTEVTRLLTEEGVEPRRIIASGRSEYFPIRPGEDADARAVNRRTEIILTPNLDELFELINN